MNVITVGIEHLMTGLQLMGKAESQVFHFERESASIVRVLSDEPFEAYWPVKQVLLSSTPKEQPIERWGMRHAEFYADTMARVMQKADKLYDVKGDELPYPIVRALRGKFGCLADTVPVHKDGGIGGPAYWFNYANMYHGIEPDGHIHT